MRNISQPREADLRAEQLLRDAGCDNPAQVRLPSCITVRLFFRRHSLRCLRTRKTKFGQLRLSVLDNSGRETYAYGKDFSEAFHNLETKFC